MLRSACRQRDGTAHKRKKVGEGGEGAEAISAKCGAGDVQFGETVRLVGAARVILVEGKVLEVLPVRPDERNHVHGRRLGDAVDPELRVGMNMGCPAWR